MDTPVPPSGGFHRGRARKETGGSSVARLAPNWGRLGTGRFLPVRIRCTSLGIFCTVRFLSAGICDRTLRPFPVGGPFPCPAALFAFQSCPAFDCSLAGEMPPLREGDRYFWGCANRRSKLLPAVFPSSRSR